MDCEYVLGISLASPSDLRATLTFDDNAAPRSITCERSFKKREIHLWVLDFDKATRFALTKNDVENKLIPAFFGNDPYYPRPDVDKTLWEEFAKVYRAASRIILKMEKVDDGTMKLPDYFLKLVVNKVEEQSEWKSEDQIIFQ